MIFPDLVSKVSKSRIVFEELKGKVLSSSRASEALALKLQRVKEHASTLEHDLEVAKSKQRQDREFEKLQMEDLERRKKQDAARESAVCWNSISHLWLLSIASHEYPVNHLKHVFPYISVGIVQVSQVSERSCC